MKVSEGFMLRVLNGEFRGKVFPLRGSIDIGSAGDCELCLRDSLVSPSHARLHSDGDEVVVEDLGSSKGTFLNERPVDRASLRTGDLLRVGGTRLSVVSNAGYPAASSPVDSETVSDPVLLKRARAAEARKVELEKARARLTRQNEELVQKLAHRLDQKKRLVVGLKSVRAANARLETLLEGARDELSQIKTERPGQGKVAGGNAGALQESLDAARAELAEQAAGHQQELSVYGDSRERLQAAEEQARSLSAKLREAEAGQAEVNRRLLEEEGKVAGSVSDQDELRLRLQALEEEKRCLESSDSDLEKQREISSGLRGEVAGLRKEIDSLLDEKKLDSRKHRGELASQAAENSQRLKKTEQDIATACGEDIERLEAEKTRMAAELKRGEEDLQKQAAELAKALAETSRGEEAVSRMQEEIEQERTVCAEFRARCAEAQKEKELLDSGIRQRQETIDSQVFGLTELEGRLRKASRELTFSDRERKKKESRLNREVEVLQQRLSAAEKKRRVQEGQLDGLRDSEASRSDELSLLKMYVDDVRCRLLEKEALLQDLGARLLLEGGEEVPVAGGGVIGAS